MAVYAHVSPSVSSCRHSGPKPTSKHARAMGVCVHRSPGGMLTWASKLRGPSVPGLPHVRALPCMCSPTHANKFTRTTEICAHTGMHTHLSMCTKYHIRSHNPIRHILGGGVHCARTAHYFYTRFPPKETPGPPLPKAPKFRSTELPQLKINASYLPSTQDIMQNAESHEKQWSQPQMSTLNNTCPS